MDAPLPKPTRRRLRWIAVGLFALLFALLGTLAWMSTTTAGTRALFSLAQRGSGGVLQVGQVEGTLANLQLRQIRLDSSAAKVEIDQLTLAWQPAALWRKTLAIQKLHANGVRLVLPASSSATPVPASLQLPFNITLADAQIRDLQLAGQPLLGLVQLTLTSDKQQHRLKLNQLVGTSWQARGEVTLATQQPFAIAGQIKLASSVPEQDWALPMVLGGNLTALELDGHGVGGGMAADYHLLLDPLAATLPQILREAQLVSNDVNLRSFSAQLPATALNISVHAIPAAGASTLAASVEITNTQPGDWQAGKLPLRRLVAQLQRSASGVEISALQATLLRGAIKASGGVSPEKLDLALDLAQVDPTQFGGNSVPWSGPLRLTGTPALPAVVGELQAGLAGGVPLALLLDAKLAQRGQRRFVLVNKLGLRSGNGKLDATGELSLQAPRPFTLKASLAQFDPALLRKIIPGAWPAGNVNATLSSEGTLADAGPALQAELNITASQLNGRALSGHAAGQWQAARLSQLRADLHLGKNKLTAQGDFGRMGDKLLADFNLPDLADLGSDFGGQLSGQWQLAGRWAAPKFSGLTRARGLKWAGRLSLDSADLDASVDLLAGAAADSPLRIDGKVEGWRGWGMTLRSARLQASGNRAAHRISLAAQGEAAGQSFDTNLVAQGRLGQDTATPSWQGQISQLDNTGRWPLHLAAPLRLSWLAPTLLVENVDLTLLGGRWQIQRAQWQSASAQLQLRGEASGIALGEWLQRLPAPPRGVSSNLQVASRFDLKLDEQLSGQLSITRQAGDIVLQSDSRNRPALPLHLQAAEARVVLQGSRAQLSASLRSADFGKVDASLNVPLQRAGSVWQLDQTGAASGTLQADMPSLAWAASLLGPAAKLDGKLQANLSLSGSLANPQWGGSANGQDLALRSPEQGINWQHGKIATVLEGRSLRLVQLSLDGGDGKVSGSGRLLLQPDAPEGGITLKFERFALQQRPDRRIVVSGDTDLAIQHGALTLTGKLTADSGQIIFANSDIPKLGSDVVIKGRARPAKQAAGATPLTLRLDLDLGDDFAFEAQGLETHLTGQLRLRASPNEALAASGSVRTVDGSYAAYGQKLRIERGVVTFTGPLDTPALDLLAVRPDLPSDINMVGIQISGTALTPRVVLTSDPVMPDNEKLSWLILGHGSASTGRGDAEVLLGAAESLFSGGTALGIRQQLAQRLGLDDISLRRSTASTSSDAASPLAGRVVSLGKRISDSVYLSYEQGLDGLSKTVKLSYKLSKSWSVAVSTGRVSAVEMVYTVLFD